MDRPMDRHIPTDEEGLLEGPPRLITSSSVLVVALVILIGESYAHGDM